MESREFFIFIIFTWVIYWVSKINNYKNTTPISTGNIQQIFSNIIELYQRGKSPLKYNLS